MLEVKQVQTVGEDQVWLNLTLSFMPKCDRPEIDPMPLVTNSLVGQYIHDEANISILRKTAQTLDIFTKIL